MGAHNHKTPGVLPDAFWNNVDKSGPVPSHAPHLGPCWVWRGRLSKLGYGEFGRLFHGRYITGAHRRHWLVVYGDLPNGTDLDHLCRNRACVRLEHLEPVSHRENCRRGLNGVLAPRFRRCARGHLRERGVPCRECTRERMNERMRALRGPSWRPRRERTACPQGHPYDTRGGHGERACSICLDRQKTASYSRKRDRELGPDRPLGRARGERSPMAKLTETDVRLIRSDYRRGGASMTSLAKAYGVSKSTILNIVNGRTWTHVA